MAIWWLDLWKLYFHNGPHTVQVPFHHKSVDQESGVVSLGPHESIPISRIFGVDQWPHVTSSNRLIKLLQDRRAYLICIYVNLCLYYIYIHTHYELLGQFHLWGRWNSRPFRVRKICCFPREDPGPSFCFSSLERWLWVHGEGGMLQRFFSRPYWHAWEFIGNYLGIYTYTGLWIQDYGDIWSVKNWKFTHRIWEFRLMSP